MTWHPLATNPLPEPKAGQTLLIQHKRYPHPDPDTFICKPERGPQWLGGGGLGDTVEMRSHFIELDPSAQWFLVPAPGEQSESAAAASELEDLVSQAIRNAGRRESTHRARWAWVTEVFAVGSTRARELCRRYGLDPDETI